MVLCLTVLLQKQMKTWKLCALQGDEADDAELLCRGSLWKVHIAVPRELRLFATDQVVTCPFNAVQFIRR